MMKPLVVSCSLALAACSLGAPVAQAVDGAPVEGALTTVIQEYQEVPIERLSELGIEAYALMH